MKRISLLILIFQIVSFFSAHAQTSGSITVGGDFDKFYPVTWYDGGWGDNAETLLEIGRSSVHTDGLWRGATMAKFNYHTTRWGHGSNFINASNLGSVNLFVAGWTDGTRSNGLASIIIWLRGGGTTYYFKGNYDVSPTVYDGSQNALPYQEPNGPSHSYKTSVDPYVNSYGLSSAGSAYFFGGANNYFAANLGIGILNPTEKLEVNGKIRAKEIKVENTNWPDYVFAPKYQLPDLKATEQFIKENKHLPEIPSAAEVEKEGVNLGEMNAKLVKKIEELTLYMIELKKDNDQIKEENKLQQKEINQLKAKL